MRFRPVIAIVTFIFIGRLISAQDFTADVEEGCTPLTVQFSITGSSSVTSVQWDFGNGETSSELTPDAVTYDTPGKYTVTAEFDGSTTETKTDFIQANETVEADFDIEDLGDYSYRFTPTTEISTDTNWYSYRWEYSSSDTSAIISFFVYSGDEQDATYDVDGLPFGDYSVMLTIINQGSTIYPLADKCIDSVQQTLKVESSVPSADSVFQAGNVFTPNSPGGEYYIINPYDASIVLYFEVFTRTGVPVYKSEAPGVYWDGRTNDGRALNSGVYFYILRSTKGDSNGFYNTSGFIHIFR